MPPPRAPRGPQHAAPPVWKGVILHAIEQSTTTRRVDGAGRLQLDFYTARRPLARRGLAVVLVDRRFFLVVVLLDVAAAAFVVRRDRARVRRHRSNGAHLPAPLRAGRNKDVRAEAPRARRAHRLHAPLDLVDREKRDARVEAVAFV